MAVEVGNNDSPLNSSSMLLVIEYDSEEIVSRELGSEDILSTNEENDFNIKDNIFGDTKHEDICVKHEDICNDTKENYIKTRIPFESQTINKMQCKGKSGRKTIPKKSNLRFLLCTMCEYQTNLKQNMTKHMNIHLGIKPYKCTFCDYRATDKSVIKDHEVSKHTGDKPLQCEFCTFRSHRSFVLNKHMKTHLSPEKRERPFPCSECDAMFLDKLGFDRHFMIHTGEKNYSCDVCDYKSRTQSNLVRHKRKHDVRKVNICPVCSKEILVKKTFEEHVQGHAGIKPFVCKEKDCEFRTTSAENLRMHIAITHSTKYSCELCDFKCGYKSSLKSHYRIHTGEKPFSCLECNYTTRVRRSLNWHMRIHTGSQPFSCDQCEYSSRKKSNVKNHFIKMHSTETPFECSICDDKFKTKPDIKQHFMRKHKQQM